MHTSKAITVAAFLALFGLSLACSPAEGDKNAKPATNTAAPATANTNAPAPEVVKVAGMPDDVQPIFAAKCKMCHGADAKGSKNAPNLFEVKDKHTAEQWVSYLKNPKIFDKDNNMPTIPLTEPEAKQLASWLAVTVGASGTATSDDKGGAADKGEKGEKDDHDKGDKHGSSDGKSH